MNPGFFTQVHDIFQMIVILQRQRDGDLVQLVFRKNVVDILDSSHHLDPLVNSAAGNPVVQNAPDHIAPLGVGVDSGNVLLRRPGIADEKNVFEIVALFPEELQNIPYGGPAQGREHDVYHVKDEHHDTGKVRLIDQIQHHHKESKPYCIGLYDPGDLILAPGSSFWRIHVEEIVQKHIPRHKEIKSAEIHVHGQRPGTGFRIRKRGCKFYIPCKQIRDCHYNSVHQQVQSVKNLLIVLNHNNYLLATILQ